MSRVEEMPPGSDGRLRFLRGNRLVGFTCRALSGEWEAHWVDAAGHKHGQPATTSDNAAKLLRAALKES